MPKRITIPKALAHLANVRMDLDALCLSVNDLIVYVPEEAQHDLSLALERMKEGRMWLAQALQDMGQRLPPEYEHKAKDERKSLDAVGSSTSVEA